MSNSEALERASVSVRGAIDRACRGLVERSALAELVVLGAVAGEHLLVIGPPGTAKSQAVRRIASDLGGAYFEYLIGSFTEPSEIFGPVSLKKLKDGVVETETAGMLPEADIAFLDEVFLGSTAILNTLLGILNERTFRRGQTAVRCPLRICVGASNRLPEDPQLLAFSDRFLLRTFVAPIGDSMLEDLLVAGSLPDAPAGPRSSLADVDVLAASARALDLGAVRPSFAEAIRLLRAGGIELTDRRIVRAQRLVAAAAVLAGRSAPTSADLWPLVFALPTEEAQGTGRKILQPLLSASESKTLANAAAQGSLGLLARAALVVRAGDDVLAARPENGGLEAWRLRVEGVAREIDATFPKEALTPALSDLRSRIVKALA